MSSIEQTDVIVLGAGPAGMFAALRLSENGARVRIVDMYRRAALHSYALALHPGTLRLFDEVGLAQTLVDHGQPVERVGIYDDRQRLASIEVAPVGGSFPHVLVLPQAFLEAALERRLRENGIDVEWGHQVLMLDTDTDAVTAFVMEVPDPDDVASSHEDVTTKRIRAEFLIGADGYRSFTRQRIGVGQLSAGYVAFGLMEFEAAIEEPAEMRLVLGPESSDVLWPLGPDRGRWSVQLDGPEDCREASDLVRRVKERAPWFGKDFGTPTWVTTVGFERRLARQFGRERIWLVGDAAHFASPLGVQSMNVGLREAHDLARRMAEILRGTGSPKLLEYYNEERQREWKILLGLEDRLRRAEDMPEWAGAMAERLVSSLPASGQDLNVLLEQVGLRLHWLRRKNGR